MKYMEFYEKTMDMNPQQRSEFFNSLSLETQEGLVDEAGEHLLLFARVLRGAEMIEKEHNVYKRQKLMKHYEKLADEYAEAVNQR